MYRDIDCVEMRHRTATFMYLIVHSRMHFVLTLYMATDVRAHICHMQLAGQNINIIADCRFDGRPL